MQVYKTINTLRAALEEERSRGRSIGFVPTMGALHEGHLSLVSRSGEENTITVVSIFVNPTQFNNKQDLENYPRMPEEDIKMLQKAGADMVFLPEVDEIYTPGMPQKTPLHLPVSLTGVMEGAFRPGHFDGVVQVVSRLFDIVQPDRAYFGEKDFQQLAVVRFMTRALNYNIEIIGCPTKRETDGLAMSSRNLRLSVPERNSATIISKALAFIRDNHRSADPVQLKHQATEMINSGNLKTEYVEIADAETLEPVTDWNKVSNARAFVAAFCGPVRLIDNMQV